MCSACALSLISWTDYTFNPWWGCVQVSPACRFCYANKLAKRYGHNVWGKRNPRRFFGDHHWNEPRVWNRKALRSGVPLRVFCASMADVFEEYPGLDGQRSRLWKLIEETGALRWLILTKRPENAAQMVPASWMRDGWPKHVWLGVSAETQRFADERVPILIDLPVRGVRFLSCEPLLAPLNLAPYLKVWRPYPGAGYEKVYGDELGTRQDSLVDWVIAGGESEALKRARWTDLEWLVGLRDQTVAAGVPFHLKQLGKPLAHSLGLPGKGDDPQLWVPELRLRDVPDLGPTEWTLAA